MHGGIRILLVVLLSTMTGAQVLSAPRQACNVQHAGATHGCRSISGNPSGPWWVIVKERAYKTCGPSDNPRDNCTERAKATHTIEAYSDSRCTQQIRRIAVDQKRCD